MSDNQLIPLSLAVLVLACCLAQPADSGLAPSLKPVAVPAPHAAATKLDSEDIVRFTKNLYKDLGSSWGANTTVVADKYRDKFNRLNATTDGQLGQTLSALFEIRMLDLQASVRHARKMRSVIESFAVEQIDARI